MAGFATTGVAGYVNTATHPVAKAINDKDRCEFFMNTKGKLHCPGPARYWVQRGPVNRTACSKHLANTVSEFWRIEPGRYGINEHSEGYWVGTHHAVVVKMKVGGGWR